MNHHQTDRHKSPTNTSDSPFRQLPSVATALEIVKQAGYSHFSDAFLTRAIQAYLVHLRRNIAQDHVLTRSEITQQIINFVDGLNRSRLAPIINATGVIIHTNLGRAPVSPQTAVAMAEVAANYVPLEIDAETNRRGGRMTEISTLMRLLTGAEQTLIVNNNAAAVLLTLSAVATGGAVIVSRGEAIEIGGGFRIPDVMRQSGANLVEVGTTNRTYTSDYENAIDDSTTALLKVHTSNFAVTGFVHTTELADLAIVAEKHQLPVIADLGSGALLETDRFGLAAEPTIGQSLAAGATIITASGDKLLGGPQAGLIAGRRDWIEKIAHHPLARAVRADKTCLAGIAATLRHYAHGDAEQTIPVWRMISAQPNELHDRAARLAQTLAVSGLNIDIEATEATIGGGSLPGQTLPSWALAIRAEEVDRFAQQLRLGQPAIFGHIKDDRLLLDLRTILPEQDETVATAFRHRAIAS